MWRPYMLPTVTSGRRLPWTRRAALEFWSRCIGMLSLLATFAIALGTALHGGLDSADATLVGVGLVAALPAAWIGLTRLAERRYLSRPPKRFLAAALGFDFGGVTLVAAAVLLLQSETSYAGTMLTAGSLLQGCGTLLLLAWFVTVLVVEPCGDHMHSL